MGVLARIGGVVRNRAKAGFPLVRQAAEALLAKGNYTPAVTATNAAGQTVVLSPEVVNPKGVLRSTTVLAGIAGALSSGSIIYENLRAGQAPEEAVIAAFLFSLGTIWRHVRSWLPTKGSAVPKPTGAAR